MDVIRPAVYPTTHPVTVSMRICRVLDRPLHGEYNRGGRYLIASLLVAIVLGISPLLYSSANTVVKRSKAQEIGGPLQITEAGPDAVQVAMPPVADFAITVDGQEIFSSEGDSQAASIAHLRQVLAELRRSAGAAPPKVTLSFRAAAVPQDGQLREGVLATLKIDTKSK